MTESILTLCFLVGPTASGKSEAALILARLLDAEIISMDSMAVYRDMDAGTAKPTREERARIPHHLIDIVNPWQPYTVARYLGDAETAIRDISSRGRRILFVGGTGLYLKRFREGLFRGPGTNPRIRERLQKRADSEDSAALHAELARLDPATAARLHPNDIRRVIRALEVCLTAERPMSELHAEHKQKIESERKELLGVEHIEYRMIALQRERGDLDKRIEARTREIFRQGLVEETRRISKQCAERISRPEDLPESWRYYMGRQTSRALGYFDVLRHINGEITLDECVKQVYTHTRQFSTKQMTWFRSFPDMHWLHLKADSEASETAEQAAALLRK